MTAHGAALFPGRPGTRPVRLWLKSDEFTTRLLTGEGGDPWRTAALYQAYFALAYDLLRPDVAVMEIDGLFASHLARSPVRHADSARGGGCPLRSLLEAEAPRATLAEALEGVCALLCDRAPLVLALPSPRHWLHSAGRMTRGDGRAFDPGEVADCVAHIADWLEAVPRAALAGVLLEEPGDDDACGPLDLACYRPLIDLAKRHRWQIGIRLGHAPLAADPSAADVDTLIGPAAELEGASCPVGIDVSDALWGGHAPVPLAAGQFYFVRIPRTLHLARVRERIALLRQGH